MTFRTQLVLSNYFLPRLLAVYTFLIYQLYLIKKVVHTPTCYCLHKLERNLICGWLCPLQYVSWKHRFELTLFFSIFSKRNQIKNNKACLKLESYSLVLESKKNSTKHRWKSQNINIGCFHILSILLKTFLQKTERYNCYFNVFYLAIQWDESYWKKDLFLQITWQVLPKLTKSVRSFQLSILWRNH